MTVLKLKEQKHIKDNKFMNNKYIYRYVKQSQI